MSLPTESQWARYSALCARLYSVPISERTAVLQALRVAGNEDPQVLSLVALHWALPPDPTRERRGDRLGDCTLEEPLGAGGMGVVYRAQQHIGSTTRPVAVKLIHPTLLQTARAEALARFQAEIATLVKLEHAGIARIYGGGIVEHPHTHEQLPYLAMELVRGGLPLTTYARDYALPWQERLSLFLRVCRAVQYAHEHRVIHRDLKPANILIDSEGNPFVIDFGLAQTYDALLPGAHLAASGTPAYMSPEQVSNVFGPISAKSDVYALGLILYELFTAQHPYALLRDGTVAQWCQVMTEAPLPRLPQSRAMDGGELEEIMAAALAKRPADRVRVDVLRARLERYLTKLPPDIDWPLPETQTWQRETQPVSRHASRDIAPIESHQGAEVDARLPTVPAVPMPVERPGWDHADAGPPSPIQAGPLSAIPRVQVTSKAPRAAHDTSAMEATALGARVMGRIEPAASRGAHTGDPQALGREERISPLPSPPAFPVEVFGRQTELTYLYRCLTHMYDGQRQVVFVTGEPGIGKTTLVKAFFQGLPDQAHLWIGRGQCIAQYGAGEPYLPLLEALGRLGREGGKDVLLTILDRYAPTWLAQMPALVAPRALPRLLQRVQGATQQRMLREIADALEVLTAERPLLLWFEDLQWSDVSTLQLLTSLALRPGQARLLIVGTFRPVDVGCPLDTMVQELHIKGACQEIALPPLGEEAVAAYVARRWADADPRTLPQLVSALYRRTEGHPLFLVHVVHYLDAQGWRERSRARGVKEMLEKLLGEVPSDLYRMIETHIACRSVDEQRVLEAASVAGTEFSTAAVAAGGDIAFERVEELCAELARHGHFLQTCGILQWPDMTLGTTYRFVHALYQEVLYHRVPVLRRIRLHQRIGLRYEEAYTGHTERVASELAVHFTQGRQFRQAVYYRRQAAETALRRSAYHEVTTHVTSGLDLLQDLPDDTERLAYELSLHASLGPALMATQGYAAPAVQAAYLRAQELCRQVQDSPYLFPILFGVWGFHLVRAEYRHAHGLACQLLHMAQHAHEGRLLVEAHGALGITAFYLGNLVASRAHLTQSREAYDVAHHQVHVTLYSQDPWVAARAWEGQVLWLLGYPEQALQAGREALTYAEEVAHPFSQVFALFSLAMIHHFRQESAACHAHAAQQIRLSQEQAFPFWVGPGMMLVGWAMAHQGHVDQGIYHLRDGLALRQAIGMVCSEPYSAALLAEGYGRLGQHQEALAMLTAALEVGVSTAGQWCDAELYRLQGVLLLAHTQAPQAAEACMQQALALARQQHAKSLELRAAMSLSRLWQQQGRRAEAHDLLARTYGWFTEGFDTVDLLEARTLLAELA